MKRQAKKKEAPTAATVRASVIDQFCGRGGIDVDRTSQQQVRPAEAALAAACALGAIARRADREEAKQRLDALHRRHLTALTQMQELQRDMIALQLVMCGGGV